MFVQIEVISQYKVFLLQWKVRRTVASSIHELAIIVGEDVATQDLVPIFTGFIKDLDEVRIGALKHLAEFLKVSKYNKLIILFFKLPLIKYIYDDVVI